MDFTAMVNIEKYGMFDINLPNRESPSLAPLFPVPTLYTDGCLSF